MLTIYFLRHATTEWNEQRRMQGRRDIPLSATGRGEIAHWRLPENLRGKVEWASSPLSRAVQTAAHFVGPSVPRDPALIEMDWGDWEGCRLDTLRNRLGAAFTQNERRGLDFRPPGGESPRDVISRLVDWLESIAERESPMAAVTHNGVLRALIACATGWDMTGKPPIRLRPETLHRFEYARGQKLRLCESNIPLVRTLSGGRPAPPPMPPPAPSAIFP